MVASYLYNITDIWTHSDRKLPGKVPVAYRLCQFSLNIKVIPLYLFLDAP